MATQQHFVVLLHPSRPTLATDASPEEQAVLQAHFAYLESLLAARQLILAGPLLDGKFGLAVLVTSSEDEARQLLAHDPAVKAHLFTPELHPFRLSLWSGKQE